MKENVLIVPRNDSALCDSLQLLQAELAPAPGWMITSQPPVRDTISPLISLERESHLGLKVKTYVFGNMGVVTDKEPSSRVEHVDLHAHQAVGMARKMVQRDALAKVHGLGVKRLPVARLRF